MLKSKRFAMLLIVALLAFTSLAHGQTQLGFGLTPCGKYNQLRQLPGIGEAFDAWVTGYLSGVNFILYTTKGVDILEGLNSNDLTEFIKIYCKGNPQHTVTEGANLFWFSVVEK